MPAVDARRAAGTGAGGGGATDVAGSPADGDTGTPAATAGAGVGSAPPRGTPPASSKPVVIHRDLKCDNIFIQGKSIKIGDLG